jgi:hypothetical protein
MTEQIRCLNPLCNKRLFDIENLRLNPEGAIVVKCRCKRRNKLTSSGLTLLEDET